MSFSIVFDYGTYIAALIRVLRAELYTVASNYSMM